MAFESEPGFTLPPKRKAGRKAGTKDSQKFEKRGRPRKSDIVKLAAEAVRSNHCQSIEEAASLFYDDYTKGATGKIISSYTPEAEQQRFNSFILKIVKELKADPQNLSLNSYRKLGELHKRKMNSPRYRVNFYRKLKAKLKAEFRNTPIEKLKIAIKESEDNE